MAWQQGFQGAYEADRLRKAQEERGRRIRETAASEGIEGVYPEAYIGGARLAAKAGTKALETGIDAAIRKAATNPPPLTTKRMGDVLVRTRPGEVARTPNSIQRHGLSDSKRLAQKLRERAAEKRKGAGNWKQSPHRKRVYKDYGVNE